MRRAGSSVAAVGLLAVGLLACQGIVTPPSHRDSPAPREDIEGVAPSCDEELAFFSDELFEPILSVQCIGCHNDNGVARGTRLVLAPPGEGALASNFESLSRVALAETGGVPDLLLRPTGLHPHGHTGGELIATDSLDYQRLLGFVDMVRGEGCETPDIGIVCDETNLSYAPPSIRRLTPDEYDRTVEALFGFDSGYGATFPADPVLNGFSNQASELTVSPLLATQLGTAAEDAAARSLADVDALTGCVDDHTESCARSFVASFGRRAFRRSMEAEEVTRYTALYVDGASSGGFEGGVALVVRAMMESPNFLYRSEVGEDQGDGTRRLTGVELASALSYALSGGPPSEALLADAESGALDTPEGRREAGERVLEGVDARRAFARFVREWLQVDRIVSVTKDATAHPGFDADVRASLAAEVDAFAAAVVFDGDATFTELLTARRVHPDATLAAFYGIDPPSTPFAPLADETRSGVLTLGAVLAVNAGPEEPSPVLRGRIVRQAMLCQTLPDPPPGVVVEPPPIDPSEGVRQRWSRHSEEEPCASCHRLMDPIGFSFEAFDAVGHYRTAETNGLPVDVEGEIVSSRSTNGEFSGVQELGAHLAESDEVRDCFVTQWFRFMRGQAESSRTACELERLETRFRETGLDIRELMLATVSDPGFALRSSADSTAPPPLPDPDPDPDPDPPPSAGTFEVDNRVDSSWPTGACHQVTVTNTGAAEAAWSVTLNVDGTINDHWNATASGDTGDVTFTGVAWNARVAPGGEAAFGFCYMR